ncbi:MAG TPA: lytic transglycosylase domain-containing protein [Thermoanaerobaculaceae bacterium]|nr:lytic transglycosylase domain-containing protein [Thermoanaerobaculaceae bacterium]
MSWCESSRMENLTPSECRRAWLRAAVSLVLPVLLSCRATPAPTLARAFLVKGDATARATAFMRVAVAGRESERRRAALLWGLYACDARSPVGALTAFDIARPEGGLARLATRRLVEALEESRSPVGPWMSVAAAPWLPTEDRVRVRLRGAEVLAARGETSAGAGLLPELAALHGDEVGRALAVTALVGDAAGGTAARSLAVGFPQLFETVFPGRPLDRLEATFSSAEWVHHAQAWLDAGEPQEALRAAARGGSGASLTAARAALRLHRPSVALGWATRGGERCAECLLERAEAYRQLAWSSQPGQRQRGFGDMLRAAQRARQLVPNEGALAGRGELLVGEALVELGRFDEALVHLGSTAAQAQPRWEWVARRLVMLQARQKAGAALPSELARTTRGRRLADYWRARGLARRGDRSALLQLAESGFPDLPAQWAAGELRMHGVAVALSAQALASPPPPAWASDLLTAGRVAEAVFAWRSELEVTGRTGPDWLGLLALAEMPPLEAVSLLVRGEPKLLSGPWQGLPRQLLERYLPLPWRQEIESAGRQTGVPPWVLAGLVRQESAWNPRARSSAGALGLAQVLPDSAAEAARALPGFPRAGDILEPGRNLTLGAAHLAGLRRTFGSWTVALASYNAGEKRVREVWEANGRKDGPDFVESLEIPETWDYVHRVVLLAEGYRILYWPEGRAYPWT